MATAPIFAAAVAVSLAFSAATAPNGGRPGDVEPTVTPSEAAAGWVSLFDGRSTDGWRGYKRPGFPEKGWVVEDGALKVIAGGGGGDIITAEQYGDFELQLEWKATPKANSGIMYRVAEKHDYPWMTGPEFQVLDDIGHGLSPTHPHSAGAMYDLCTPAEGKVLRPAGEWNHARIMIKDGVARHWINGKKVVECRIDDAAWAERIAGSKFKGYEGFGVQPRGHIALQDHGDTVWYRNIKIRDLDAPMPGEVTLFNGENTSGWTAISPEASSNHRDPAATWKVVDGVLVCSGAPAGYLRTNEDYTNYVLRLQWRFNPVTKQAGNSGVLLRMIGEDKVWPKSVEAQLQSGNAGDFWNIDNFRMTTDPARTSGRNTKKLLMAENPVGEWNDYEIIVDGGEVTLWVNGELVNRATDVEEVAGKICLQAEGAEIHFRDIRLAEIK